MKKRLILCLSLPSALLVGLFAFSSNKQTKEVKVKGYDASSLPTTIDLNDTSASDIRSYYSSLNSLSTSQRQGMNLLKNLKTILKTGQKYYSYDDGNAIWQMYEISDRDWDKSPASSTTYGTYNSSTNKITGYTYGTSKSSSKNNPYIHALYINRNVDNQTTAWDDHNQDEWGINREHVWPKAEGFDGKDGTSSSSGARGDPMHLMAGNGYSNNIHSNYYYGYVKTSSTYTDCGSTYSNQSGNLRGTSKTLNTGTVFEPQDCDKGDIARAIFYMVARYNYLSGSDSDGIDSNNPNLELTQDMSDWSSSSYASTTSTTGKMGIMTDLLAWHHADPVDEYEIHRNNLLYTNFTNNRNPFIDFPEWADFIWGSVNYSGSTYISNDTTPTGYATPSSDTINGYNPVGPVTSVTGVSLDKSSVSLSKGGSTTLVATVTPNDASDKSVSWSTSDTAVASVNNGVVTAVEYGVATITVTTSDGGFTDTCEIIVQPSSISASVSKDYVVGETISASDITVVDQNSDPVSGFNFANDGYQFTYSDAASGGSLTNKTFSNAVTLGTLKCSLTVKVQREAYEDAGEAVSDTLDPTYTGITGTNYKSWSDKAAPDSSAYYNGHNAGGSSTNPSIQLRSGLTSNTYYSGIVSTVSGGQLASVSVDWNSNTTSGKSLTIYGKNTAYATPNDLHDESARGDLLGTITKGGESTLTITGSYLFVGIRNEGSATIYLNSVTFNYGKEQTPENVANFIMYEDTVNQCESKTDTAIGYYDQLSDSGKETFMTSDDYVISTARVRFQAWLKNQGKVINLDYSISSAEHVEYLSVEENNTNFVVILAVLLTSTLTFTACLVIKKRKSIK